MAPEPVAIPLHTSPKQRRLLDSIGESLGCAAVTLGSMRPSMACGAWTLPNPWGRLDLLRIGLGATVYRRRFKTARALK